MSRNQHKVEQIKENFNKLKDSNHREMLVYCDDWFTDSFSYIGIDDTYSPWYAHEYLQIEDPQKYHRLIMAFDLSKTFEEQYRNDLTSCLDIPEFIAMDPIICIPDRMGTKPNCKYDTLTETFARTELKKVVDNASVKPKDPIEPKEKRPRPDHLKPVK